MGNHGFQAKFVFFSFDEISLKHAEKRRSSLWTKNNVKTAQNFWLRLFKYKTENKLPFLDSPSTLDSVVQSSDKSLIYDF